jgi:epoxide hydrolase
MVEAASHDPPDRHRHLDPSVPAEFLHIIGPLADPRAHGGDPADAFHVIAPALPGFGFSGPTRSTGWGFTRIARAWAELMRRLGYDRYIAQGGDMGGLPAGRLAAVRAACCGFRCRWSSW